MLNVQVQHPLPPEGAEVWWRADDRRYANYDPFEEIEQDAGSHLVISLQPFEVLRHTPKGAWVRSYLGPVTFVLGVAAKQIAVPTQALALQDLVRRKEKHARMAEIRAAEARAHLEAARKAYAVTQVI